MASRLGQFSAQENSKIKLGIVPEKEVDWMTILEQMGQKAKEASRALAVAGAKKDATLMKMADAIEAHEAEILAANEKDLCTARESGMRESLLDRLALSSARITGMAQGVRGVAAQKIRLGRL